jgi:hypothetical protein
MRITTLAVACSIAFAVADIAYADNLVISKDQIDTSSSGWEKDVKKHSAATLTAQNDAWTMYFVAFLNKQPGAKEVQLVFYDSAVKQHEPTNAFAIATQPSAKILTSNITISPEQNFKAGHTYKVMVTRLVGGKEVVYAATHVTLK